MFDSNDEIVAKTDDNFEDLYKSYYLEVVLNLEDS